MMGSMGPLTPTQYPRRAVLILSLAAALITPNLMAAIISKSEF